MKDNQLITLQTKAWVETIIVKHNICPFAGREAKHGRIRFSVFDNQGVAQCLEYLISECRILDENNEIETTLIILPGGFIRFDEYLDLVDIANALMLDEGYEGIYQLATFHPEYCFADAEQDDAANYTNRSPYPMLHIIREASLEQALKDYPDPEAIPDNNIKMTRNLGLEKMQAMLQACYDIKNKDQ
jgi:uncharacterized protein